MAAGNRFINSLKRWFKRNLVLQNFLKLLANDEMIDFYKLVKNMILKSV